ncbi:MAG TPA: hypothetical protein VGX25_00080 [Actinophytocola sp.]|uniref:hypothetical protein n=1 Tax=Actinophytocola sp. TaxID=1872138 RepID=UPI002DDD63A6|nr:hypothetical protein [Actinophytocola sp.]HEV2777774.1 hypothetical protein [Actinophytocola sp.]
MDPTDFLHRGVDTADDLRRQGTELRQVIESARPFVNAAQSGSFGISENAGQALLDAIHQCQDKLEWVQKNVDRIQQNTRLGTSPDAVAMARFNREVAAGDSNSATQALQDLQVLLAQMESGVAEAMRHYRRMDSEGAGAVRRAGS